MKLISTFLVTACYLGHAAAVSYYLTGTSGGQPFFTKTTTNTAAPANSIEILSFSWDAEIPTNIGSQTTGLGAGKISGGRLAVSRYQDQNSPNIFVALAKGQSFTNLTLAVVSDIPPVSYIVASYEMGVAGFANIGQSADSSGGNPIPEQLQIVFGTIKMTVNTLDAQGRVQQGVTKGWDLRTNVAL